MKYLIYIKSHADAPDYEDTCEARNIYQAAEIFATRISRRSEDAWNPVELAEYIEPQYTEEQREMLSATYEDVL